MLYPKTVQIEIVDNCNLKCAYCDFPKEITQNNMNYKEFTSIVDQALYAEEICPQFWGEPTMHPDFLKMLEYIKKSGKKASYFTNGVLLSNFPLKELLENTDQIKISMDVIDAEQYLKLNKFDYFEKVLTNVKNIWEVKNRYQLKTKIVIRATKISSDHLYWNNFKNFWGKYCNEIEIKALRSKDYNSKNIIKPLVTCNRILRHCIIKKNGDLIVCPTDYRGDIKISNVFEVGLLEAFNSKKFTEIRKEYLSSELCKKCWYRY